MRTLRASAFTLVELMVAVSLGVLVVAMTWTAFARAKSATTRAGARVALHQTAGVLQEAFERDVGNLAPALAIFVASSPSTTGSTRSETLDLVFMRSAAPLDKQFQRDDWDRYLADHHWVRWRFVRTLEQQGAGWTVISSALKRSTSTPIRFWNTTSALAGYAGYRWINIPRPLRDASQGVATLDNNHYGVPSGAVSPTTDIGDIGDAQDLDRNEQFVSSQVTDFAIGWLRADGTAVQVASDYAGAPIGINGLYLDVVGPDNGRYLDERQDPVASVPGPARVAGEAQYDYRPDLEARPRVVRVLFRLKDKATQVEQTFAFSTAVPGMRPATSEPSR